MALVNIFTDKLLGRKRGTKFSLADTVKDKNLKDFVVDVTLTENHDFQADVTENPVEEGSPITDHIDLKPESFTITGVISDTPLDIASSVQGATTTAGVLIGRKIVGPLGAYAGVAAGAVAGLIANEQRTLGERSSSRTKNVFDHFRDLQAKRVPFTVVTGLREYKNMVITSLTVNRDSKSGRSFNFTCAMKQIRIVRSQVITIPNTFKGVSGAAPKQDLGAKSAEQATGDKITITARLFDAAKGALTGGK